MKFEDSGKFHLNQLWIRLKNTKSEVVILCCERVKPTKFYASKASAEIELRQTLTFKIILK